MSFVYMLFSYIISDLVILSSVTAEESIGRVSHENSKTLSNVRDNN